MTMMFLLIILGSADRRAPQGFAPIAIGLGLTLIHLISVRESSLFRRSTDGFDLRSDGGEKAGAHEAVA